MTYQGEREGMRKRRRCEGYLEDTRLSLSLTEDKENDRLRGREKGTSSSKVEKKILLKDKLQGVRQETESPN